MLIKQFSTCAATAVVVMALTGGWTWAANEQTSSQTQSQIQAPQGDAQAAKLKGHDREFVNKAAQGGLMEVEAAKLAMDRASSADVKSFAETLHRDHTTANQKLMQIAQQKGVELPKQLDSKHRQELDKLSKLKGEEFDKAFMQQMGMKDHKQDIQLFERQAKEGSDPQLKSFAQETLPTLRNHLAMAQKIGSDRSAQSDSHKAGSSASSQDNAAGSSSDRKQQ